VKVLILNGPNIDALGVREPEIYGKTSLSDIELLIQNYFNQHEIVFVQLQKESDIIVELKKANSIYDGIVINAGGYTHTSVSIRDTIKIMEIPVVEVHISNIFEREYFRNKSLLSKVCVGTISGFGTSSYAVAISSLIIQNQLWNTKEQ